VVKAESRAHNGAINLSGMLTWLRGLWLLRHAELVVDLGERRLQLMQLRELSQRCPGTRIGSHVRLLAYDPARLTLGQGATVCDGSVLSFGDESNGRGTIRIGEHSWIGQYNNLRAGGGDIHIGRDCLISQFCSIIASNHAHARSIPIQTQGVEPGRRGVVIGDDVWFGAGCAVMPGVCIGNGAIIGANAVVTCNVPSNEIWGGIPARKIGERE